ncbi:MAG: TonB-dependent receptor, partial [Pseudomonadota bacterium]
SAGPFPNLVTLNAERAQSYGLEFAMSYQVHDNLRITANAGVLHTEIEQFDSLPSVEGNEFGDAPGYSLGAGVEWSVLEDLMLSANVQHFDGYYSDDLNTPAYAVDPYTIASARATYQIHENLQIYGYVDNIFDERVPTNLEASRTVSGATEAAMTAPRMFGIGAKATF